MTHTALAPMPRHAEQVKVLHLRGLGKRFPGVVALEGVDLEVWSGEVHGLVGENGAGKSTLIKMVTGADEPDSGAVEIFGNPARRTNARERRAAGVSAIYQELTIVPNMSAAANVFLDNPPRLGPLVRRGAMREGFRVLCRRFGLAIDPDAPAVTLSIASRQMIEIMRTLATDCRLMIMDEPTATLGPSERAKLYEVIRELKAAGVAIVFISHDLDEVLDLCDAVSVMRGGRLVASGPRGEWTKERMVAAMIGAKPSAPPARTPRGDAPRLLSVENLSVPGRIDGISFTLGEGEVLGLAGLVGSGRTEILRAIAGDYPLATGLLTLGDREGPLPASVRAAVDLGIVLVPEDRKKFGFVPLLPGWENIALTDPAKVAWAGIVNRRTERALAERSTRPVGFNPTRLGQPVGTLSGGNQQKLVIGKWLHRQPRLLLLDEPTRGVDIGAKAEIYAAIRRLVDDGLSVILVSSEMQEVVEQSDRILVVARRGVVGEFNARDTSVSRLLSLIFEVEGSA